MAEDNRDHENVRHFRQLIRHRQRTEEWFAFRKGRLTASILGYGITKTGKFPLSLIHMKVYSDLKENGGFTRNHATMHGEYYESVALELYRQRTGLRVYDDFGCQEHPKYPWLAGSPDGIIAERNGLIEVKCPGRNPARHYRSEADLKKKAPVYWHQVQALMEIFRLDYCDFLVYLIPYRDIEVYIRNEPHKPSDYRGELIVFRVERDRHWMQKHYALLHRQWVEVVQLQKLLSLAARMLTARYRARKAPTDAVAQQHYHFLRTQFRTLFHLYNGVKKRQFMRRTQKSKRPRQRIPHYVELEGLRGQETEEEKRLRKKVRRNPFI